MNDLNEFTGLVRRCVDDYGMLREGDRVAVGVSGGKDSLVLLLALRHLQSYYPARFELEAVTADLGFEGMDFTPVAKLCAELGVPYTPVKTDIRDIVFDVRRESNPCSLCAKMRRGALNTAVKERGCNKLALGHHFDDAADTFLMSLVFEGRLNCFKPVTYMSRADVWQIRPLLYAEEKRVAQLAELLKLPVVASTCPEDKTSRRRDIEELLQTLSLRFPDIKSKIFGAMQRLPLDGWAPRS